MIALDAVSGGTRFPLDGSGLTNTEALNGFSPTANLAGVNIKGNEAHPFVSRVFVDLKTALRFPNCSGAANPGLQFIRHDFNNDQTSA